MLDAALRIAAKGTPVFPCGPDKAPRVAGGFKSATTDPALIRTWTAWLDEGTMIGAAVPAHQIVVDIDPRNGGDETMALFPELPRDRVVRTRSGGTHVYLTVPQDIGDLRAQLGPGVDIKRPGKGYVIVPPSDGYRYLGFRPAAPAPEWLLDELTLQTTAARHAAADPKFGRFEKGTAYGVMALNNQIGRLVQAKPGERNDALNRATFSLAQLVAGGELAEEHAREELALTANLIGLEREETMKTIESGWAAGLESPWQAPKTGAEKQAGDSESLSRVGGTYATVNSAPDESNFWVDWEQEEPDLPFFIWPMLPKHAYVLAYGATEASKSMAWVGLLAEASHHDVRTSVYSLENPPATDRQRVRRWRPDPAHFRLTNQHLDFNDGRSLDALLTREKDWGDGRGTDVLLIDTYSHAFHSYSEDGNAKAIAFAQRVRWLMSEVGCSVIVIDHTGYAQMDEPRDASAKRQQVDVAVLMKKAGIWEPGKAAKFTMDNKKAARFANPFFLTGEIQDDPTIDPPGLKLGWIGDGPRWPE
jgi:hypothetical protein